jgi:hypothetical protein
MRGMLAAIPVRIQRMARILPSVPMGAYEHAPGIKPVPGLLQQTERTDPGKGQVPVYDLCVHCMHPRYDHNRSGCMHPEIEESGYRYCDYCPSFTAV